MAAEDRSAGAAAVQLHAAPGRINLDAAANAPVTLSVIDAVVGALGAQHANPSSEHQAGAQSRWLLSTARDAVAALLEGADEEGVLFTSGCTEANNMVLAGLLQAGGTLITTAVEHPSILRPAAKLSAGGIDVRQLAVDADGLVALETLRAALKGAAGPVLVSIQAANSETGVIQDVRAIAQCVSARDDAIFHSDCAQAFAKHKIALGRGIGPDVVTVSGHKVNGPMGSGAVVIAAESELRLEPLILGGDQEQGLRAGTQALPAIAGFGAACAEWAQGGASERARLRELQDRLEQGLLERVPAARVNGAAVPRLPNITSITFPGAEAMALVAQLDERGVAVSQGSACSSRRPEPSHVLTAMGLPEADAFSTIRLSLSRLTSREEVERALDIVADVALRQRRLV